MKNTFLNMIRPSNEEMTQTEDTAQSTAQNLTETMEEKKQNRAPFESVGLRSDFSRFESSGIFTNAGKDIKIAEPRTLEDAEAITAAIHDGIGIMLFLDEVNEEKTASRILDFVNGFCHAYSIVPQATKQETLWLYDPKNKKSTTSFR